MNYRPRVWPCQLFLFLIFVVIKISAGNNNCLSTNPPLCCLRNCKPARSSCYCDTLCHKYGNCCPDYVETCERRGSTHPPSSSTKILPTTEQITITSLTATTMTINSLPLTTLPTTKLTTTNSPTTVTELTTATTLTTEPRTTTPPTATELTTTQTTSEPTTTPLTTEPSTTQTTSESATTPSTTEPATTQTTTTPPAIAESTTNPPTTTTSLSTTSEPTAALLTTSNEPIQSTPPTATVLPTTMSEPTTTIMPTTTPTPPTTELTTTNPSTIAFQPTATTLPTTESTAIMQPTTITPQTTTESASKTPLATTAETTTIPVITTLPTAKTLPMTALPYATSPTITPPTSTASTSPTNMTKSTFTPQTTAPSTTKSTSITTTTPTTTRPPNSHYGCFLENSTVQLEDGSVKLIKDVRIKDRVLAVDTYGKPVFSEVILLMDVLTNYVGEFVVIEAAGRHLHLTPTHLLFVSDTGNPQSFDPVPVFSGQVKEGQFVYMAEPGDGGVQRVRVEKVYTVLSHGAYAPLTEEGTIVVDHILASCYAVFSNPKVAHWTLAPFRWLHNVNNVLQKFTSLSLNLGQDPDYGMAWYPNILYQVATHLHIL